MLKKSLDEPSVCHIQASLLVEPHGKSVIPGAALDEIFTKKCHSLLFFKGVFTHVVHTFAVCQMRKLYIVLFFSWYSLHLDICL